MRIGRVIRPAVYDSEGEIDDEEIEFRVRKKPLLIGLRRLKAAFCSLAEHLQFGPRRRRLPEVENTPDRTPNTPQKRSRQLLGRTPAKLYSPFGIETPCYKSDKLDDSLYYPSTPERGCSPDCRHHKTKSQVWRLLHSRPRSLFH